MSNLSVVKEIYSRYCDERKELEKEFEKLLPGNKVVFGEFNKDSNNEGTNDIIMRIHNVGTMRVSDITSQVSEKVSENVYCELLTTRKREKRGKRIFDYMVDSRYYVNGDRVLHLVIGFENGCKSYEDVDKIIMESFECMHDRVKEYNENTERLLGELERKLNLKVDRYDGLEYSSGLSRVYDYDSEEAELISFHVYDEGNEYMDELGTDLLMSYTKKDFEEKEYLTSTYFHEWNCFDGTAIGYSVVGVPSNR